MAVVLFLFAAKKQAASYPFVQPPLIVHAGHRKRSSSPSACLSEGFGLGLGLGLGIVQFAIQIFASGEVSPSTWVAVTSHNSQLHTPPR